MGCAAALLFEAPSDLIAACGSSYRLCSNAYKSASTTTRTLLASSA